MRAPLNVKVGDKLVRSGSGWGPPLIVTVERVMPSGRFVAGGETWNPNGMVRGGGYYSNIVRVPTQDDYDEIERHKLLLKAQRMRDEIRLTSQTPAALLKRYVAALEPLHKEVQDEARRIAAVVRGDGDGVRRG